jgi:hypothetical protein
VVYSVHALCCQLINDQWVVDEGAQGIASGAGASAGSGRFQRPAYGAFNAYTETCILCYDERHKNLRSTKLYPFDISFAIPAWNCHKIYCFSAVSFIR